MKFKIGDYVTVITDVFNDDEYPERYQTGLSGHIFKIEPTNYTIWIKYDEESRLKYGEPTNTYNQDHLEFHKITKTKLYKALN